MLSESAALEDRFALNFTGPVSLHCYGGPLALAGISRPRRILSSIVSLDSFLVYDLLTLSDHKVTEGMGSQWACSDLVVGIYSTLTNYPASFFAS
jgi:hypothetical protein